MNRGVSFACLLTLAVCAPPAHAVQWSIGANLGLSVDHHPGGTGGTTHWGLPAAAGAGDYNQGALGGLRAGLLSAGGHHGIFLDGGLRSSDYGDSGQDSFQLTGNYEFAPLSAPHAWSPYATAGWGWDHSEFHFSGPSPNRWVGNGAIYGGGVGVRYRVGHDHGLLRGELRYDRVNGASDRGDVLIPRSNSVALKVGFDLWL